MSTIHRALCAGLSLLAFAFPAHAGMPVSSAAVVAVAEGAPFVMTRGTVAYTGSKGIYLSPGDLIESKPDSLMIVEFRIGAVLSAVAALGPATRAYWMERPDGTTLALLSGWIKVDTLAPGLNKPFKVVGTRLGAASSAGTFIVRARDGVDEVYHESGTMTLWVQKPDGSGTSRISKLNEFASRGGSADVQTQPRPSDAFGNALPAAFRDPLPTNMSTQLRSKVDPKMVRDVSYDDVSGWLSGPREWRQGFIARFRPRLKDSAFFHALDDHMSVHPEWERILHPPPPPPPENVTAARSN